jgi:hypothetical protein
MRCFSEQNTVFTPFISHRAFSKVLGREKKPGMSEAVECKPGSFGYTLTSRTISEKTSFLFVAKERRGRGWQRDLFQESF